MFPGVPPTIRVALRHRRWAIVGAGLAGLALFVYSSVETVYVLREQFPHDVSVVQLDPGEFPEYLWPGSENATGRNDGDSNSQMDNPSHGGGLLLTTNSNRPITNPTFPVFTPGTPKPAGQEYSKALVIAHMKKEEVDWVDQLPADKKWSLYLYATDDLRTPTGFHTPLNKGREAMAYLSYIVEHYAALPDVTVFMHAHRTSWHDDQFGLDSVEALKRLNLDRVTRLGYVNIRCYWHPGCPDHIHPADLKYDINKPEQSVFARAWGEIFPLDPMPESLSQPCCAQFALTAERIRALPQSEYVKLRDWMLTTEIEDGISGRIFEYLYHLSLTDVLLSTYRYIWTRTAVLCPDEHDCYCDGYGICFGGRHKYQEFVVKRDEWNRLNQQVDEFVKSDSNGFTAEDINAFVERLSKGEETIDEIVAWQVKEKGSDNIESQMTDKEKDGKQQQQPQLEQEQQSQREQEQQPQQQQTHRHGHQHYHDAQHTKGQDNQQESATTGDNPQEKEQGEKQAKWASPEDSSPTAVDAKEEYLKEIVVASKLARSLATWLLDCMAEAKSGKYTMADAD
ncbi:hypothetical protein B0H66DRAFT_137127 [Apodospora peruviana]|uniref:Uncharacterized protein n=1 Tax=Apodospora peruviana TaxID=516989 RepID=A0AAE0IIL5_9PEZI|nr:hypothetical protein B0H66DRAFT_137127 [Apodospora peruviana]